MPSDGWRSAHDMLGDNAERFAQDWEGLLAMEDAGAGVRELLSAGLSVAEVSALTGVARNTVKQAAFRWRRVTPNGV
ncbi:MAG: hypothetical protein ACHQ9S_27140 [Candidatus Binatia bacterium]